MIKIVNNKHNSNEPSTNSNMFRFLKKSYDEALELITYSRDYFNLRGRLDKAKLSPKDSLAYTLVMSTITTQLTSVLSWLMIYRAIEEGELKVDKIKKDDLRLPKFNVVIKENDPIYKILPEQVRNLLKDSTKLYKRIKRIESNLFDNNNASSAI